MPDEVNLMAGQALNDATVRQIEAADPLRSTWLTANAGSGKTRVLTDRVARLLLAGTRPERVLCLTYTKAAATEMQNRLLKRLGEWAMLPDADLRARLNDLGGDTPADLAAARRLFAQAIETPGGLKVQTIHSFCGAILRRFPLEAGVPHGFTELDERSAALLRAEILDEMAETGEPVVGDLTGLLGDDRLERFLAELGTGFEDRVPEAALARLFDLPDDADEAWLIAQVFDGDEVDLLGETIAAMRLGKTTDVKAADKLVHGNWPSPSLKEVQLLEGVLLFGASAATPFAVSTRVPTKATATKLGAKLDALRDLAERVQNARDQRLALQAFQNSAALNRFGHRFASVYTARKAAAGWLDFNDLIDKTARLLSTSDMAQWVLFRLDGGIDHILVDEAQDTSPRQWQVIRRLTDEFTGGAGAVDRPRTLFVVGDPKQSIYSFQGADIAVFNAMRDKFGHDFAQVGAPMQLTRLEYSFRSSPAILQLVDAVFSGPAGEGLGGPPRHLAFHGARPGRVDVWDPIPKPEKPEENEWHDPVDQPSPDSEIVQLADAIAMQIATMVGSPIETDGGVRPLRFGDILILVQRRGTIFTEVIRALKRAALPVAGADRLKLGAELAVRDIRAVLSFLALPEDDLSLASALRSPLFGWSEDGLYRLAAGRGRTSLWERLRALDPPARHVLSDLLGTADFMRPHEVISRLLVRHGGRALLVGRLGIEAEDGIDELMSQALAYERSEVPSLTGFLVWLSDGDVEVKRQPGSAGDMIRVMTVHGSKGLESPVVILPDTAVRRPATPAPMLRSEDLPVLWAGPKASQPGFVAEKTETRTEDQEEERRRLLYVALTRAESWLIVAAAGEVGSELKSWHAIVSDGLQQFGADLCEIVGPNDIPVRRLEMNAWPLEPGPETAVAAQVYDPLPGVWRGMPARFDEPPLPVTATGLGGAKVLSGGAGDRGEAMLRGTRLHLLLEVLAVQAREDWVEVARAVLAQAEGGLPDSSELADLLDEVRGVLDGDQAMARLAPQGAEILTEVALTAPLPNGGALNGVVDRLIVSPDQIRVIDYKSNRDVPATTADIPEGLLRQMAAYRFAVRKIWPERAVEAAILWTATADLMVIPDPLLNDAWARALDDLKRP